MPGARLWEATGRGLTAAPGLQDWQVTSLKTPNPSFTHQAGWGVETGLAHTVLTSPREQQARGLKEASIRSRRERKAIQRTSEGHRFLLVNHF